MGIEFNEPIYPTKNHTYFGTICSSKINQKLKNKYQPCEICGANFNIEKHHEDYSKPFDVRYLCKIHHLDLHRIFRQLDRKKKLELF
jgi:hypothetical protein